MMFPILWQRSPVESRKTIVVLVQTGSRWGSSTVSCRSAPDFWEGLPVLARGVSKSGRLPDGLDFNYWQRDKD
ncbi:MAG: hypothetical protein PWR07_201 [Bacillota bacterium]|nr:hypothetical protein [Bacillota bacterium]